MNSRGVFSTFICAILAYSTGSTVVLGQIALGAGAPLADAVGGDGLILASERTEAVSSQSPFSETTDGQSPDAGPRDGGLRPSCSSRWTASADFITWDRIGSVHYALISNVPSMLSPDPGTELLNASDLRPGFAGGPKFGLMHHGDDGQDLEVSYLQIDGWNDFRGAAYPQTGTLLMLAPGDFAQYPNDRGQGMYWNYTSQLYTAEVNARWRLGDRVTALAGFRWFDVTEDLQGVLLPPEPLSTGSFWDSRTKNNLYGVQIGADVKLLRRDRFSIDGVLKTGMFDNHAEETTTVRMQRIQFPETAATDHLAFVGEIGVQCKYQVAERLSIRAGYEALWLDGVALAPGQIAETYCHYSIVPQEITVTPLGVNCNSGVFYHGANAGLELSF
jgi:hypothetical protein